jgi:DHA1 family bicyclomycin/chloramphenicol resistance-like MFS transporter
MASFFVFIASASFVYAEAFGLTPTQFSLAFALNAVGFFGASQMAARLGMRFGAQAVMVRATTGFAVFTIGLFLLALAGISGLWLTIGGLFLANACLGLVIPTAMVVALEEHGPIAGLASSLGGTMQMLAGGVMIAVSAPFFDGTVLPMLAAIALCGALAFVLALVVARLPAPEAQPSA